ncbi:MAG: riboflavin biosynthesis protein RibF [Phycisphaera sp.]|nr:riboflavin biosynthesis protein RibF [Phycisphaera sp.]
MLRAMLKRASVLTLGNFDGVHVGHRALLDAVCRRAAEASADAVAMTFASHPAKALRPEAAPQVLMDAPQKMAALLDAGIDRIEWLAADMSVLGLEPRRFVESMVERFRPVAWVEGPNFRFGKGRAGDVAMLRELGAELGFAVEIIEPVEVTLRDRNRCTVSSSLVRWLVAAGRVADAAICMGRPFAVRGEVVKGERRGAALGFPTANIDIGERVAPADGVYGGEVDIDGAPRLAAISVGTNPTFNGRRRTFEAFVLDYDGDLYGQTLEVRVTRWLRDQMTFAGVGPLVEQMRRDVATIRRLGVSGMLHAADCATAGS